MIILTKIEICDGNSLGTFVNNMLIVIHNISDKLNDKPTYYPLLLFFAIKIVLSEKEKKNLNDKQKMKRLRFDTQSNYATSLFI